MVFNEANLNWEVILERSEILSVVIVFVAKSNGLRSGLNKKDDKSSQEANKARLREKSKKKKKKKNQHGKTLW